MNENIFNIEHQFKMYLQRIGFANVKLNPIQLQEMKRAFFGAFGLCLLLFRDYVSEFPEERGIEILEGMLNECGEYFKNEVKKHDEQRNKRN